MFHQRDHLPRGILSGDIGLALPNRRPLMERLSGAELLHAFCSSAGAVTALVAKEWRAARNAGDCSPRTAHPDGRAPTSIRARRSWRAGAFPASEVETPIPAGTAIPTRSRCRGARQSPAPRARVRGRWARKRDGRRSSRWRAVFTARHRAGRRASSVSASAADLRDRAAAVHAAGPKGGPEPILG